MVVEWFIGLAGQVFGWAATNMSSSTDLNGVIVKSGTSIVPIVQSIGSLSVWIPWGTIATCMAVLFPVYVASFLFKLARAVAAHLPVIGGNG